MVSGASSAILSATLLYASVVSLICSSLPLPTVGTIMGGCGTIKAAATGIGFSFLLSIIQISPVNGNGAAQSLLQFSDKRLQLLYDLTALFFIIGIGHSQIEADHTSLFVRIHMKIMYAESRIKDLSEDLAITFISRIPAIRELVDTDMEAFYQGDPAAYNKEEIVLCYPGLLASTVNRLAHELFLLKVPLIPRMMTEYAHSRTGIDIHPGATIGRYFFMDHGTGIVVGETSVIGEHVKIYQGVTIGALSTRGGQSLRGAKRHPTIEDDVTIYAGASILGGETVIGRGSVIGSNVFITSSVKPGTRMSVRTQELVIKHREEIEGPREEAEDGGKPENWYLE